jgi:hypothetical protein
MIMSKRAGAMPAQSDPKLSADSAGKIAPRRT